MIKTIGEGWESFREDVIDPSFPNPPSMLIDLCKKCFYSGAAALTSVLNNTEGEQEIETLWTELQHTLMELADLRPGDSDA